MLITFTDVQTEARVAVVQDGHTIKTEVGKDATFEVPPGRYTIAVRHPRSSIELRLEADFEVDITIPCARVKAQW